MIFYSVIQVNKIKADLESQLITINRILADLENDTIDDKLITGVLLSLSTITKMNTDIHRALTSHLGA